MHETYTVAAGSDSGRGFPAGRLGPPVSIMPARRIIVVSRLIIACASIAVVAIALAAGIGYYAAALSVYENWLAPGRDVVFPLDTRIEIQTSPLRAPVLTSAVPPGTAN